MSARPAGSCAHRPISNGWSQSWSPELGYRPSSSYCGYCKAVIEHDDEWIKKLSRAGKSLPMPAGSDPAYGGVA